MENNNFIINSNSNRFIPLREETNYINWNKNRETDDKNNIYNSYNTLLKNNLANQNNYNFNNNRICSFSKKENNDFEFQNYSTNQNKKSFIDFKKLKNTPYKILEAPCLKDDFYNNLVDWGNNNVIAVGLDNTVFLWNYYKEEIIKLSEYENEEICSIKFSQQGKVIAVGLSNGNLELFDFNTLTKIRELNNHYSRIGVISWHNNLVATGSKDNTIVCQDLRENNYNSFRNNATIYFKEHDEEICGLKFSQNGNFLASGGNDNEVYVWNLKKSNYYNNFSGHTGAVKALEWSPFNKNILISGGGSKDKYFNKINKILEFK